MLPYQAVAMDYAGYQRQSNSGPPTGPPPPHPSMLSMTMGGPSFTHSWLVPTQDLCAVPYKQLPNQHPNSAMPSNQQLLEPGHVSNPIFYPVNVPKSSTLPLLNHRHQLLLLIGGQLGALGVKEIKLNPSLEQKNHGDESVGTSFAGETAGLPWEGRGVN